ncbi:MAG TPA: hypothetical protein VN456_12255 [Desulfosporosinus sp.]|nr:hypothetical protein [Desulfosporosinus sp.]
MNKPKFTPGPWEVEETEDGHVIKMGNAIEHEGIFDSHCEVNYDHMCWYDEEVDESHPTNKQAAEAEANVYLIAAAPDMYEALKLYEEFESQLILDSDAWGNEDGLPRFTQALLDKWMEIQAKRDEVLGKAQGGGS